MLLLLPVAPRLTQGTGASLPPTAPTPLLAMGRCFFLPTLGRLHSLMHHPARISGEAILTAQALVLHFRALPDDLCFELDCAALSVAPAWVASYALRCQHQPTAPVSAWYHYAREHETGLSVSTLRLSADSPKLRGNVTITAYDDQRQLLSGHYEVRATNQLDPTTTGEAAPCTIILAGDFNHVKVKFQ